MKLFVNDIAIEILSENEVHHEKKIDLKENIQSDKLKLSNLSDTNLIKNPSEDQIVALIKELQDRSPENIRYVGFIVSNPVKAANYIISNLTLVEAAGGLVKKGDKYLIIYRLSRWDLPKGKVEEGESPETCALREVEEECNIQVEINDFIGRTWHTYFRENHYVLKKTYWYAMNCIDDSQLRPQYEEDIDQIKWMDKNETRMVLQNSYASIKEMFNQYLANNQTSSPE